MAWSIEPKMSSTSIGVMVSTTSGVSLAGRLPGTNRWDPPDRRLEPAPAFLGGLITTSTVAFEFGSSGGTSSETGGGVAGLIMEILVTVVGTVGIGVNSVVEAGVA